jgi:ABC-type transport system substrate-binding protein
MIHRVVHRFPLLLLLLLSCEPEAERAHRMRIFRYNQPEGVTSLDPAFARSQSNIWAVGQLFNGLTSLSNNLMVQPCLAKSWTVSEDGLEYTFYLQDHVFFHEDACFFPSRSRALTAEDVVYSFKRIIDPATASPGAWIFLDKVISDANGKPSDTCFQVLDSLSLRIYLKKPFPAFPELLAMPYGYVVPHEAIRIYGKEFRSNPVGSGPFRFKEWEEGVHLSMLRHDQYWRFDSAGHRLPYLDAVQISFITDRNQAFLTLLQGKIDFVSDLNESAREMLFFPDGRLREDYQEDIKVVKGPYLNTEYLGIQTDPAFYTDQSHPLLDRRVRQALNYGLDRKNMMSYVLYNKGIAGTQGFAPPVLMEGQANYGYSYDPKKAAALLSEAGYPGGKGIPALGLYTTALYPYKEIAEYVQKQWSLLGIKVKIETGTTATIRELVDQGKVQFFRASWLGDYPDAENYFAVCYGKHFSPAGPNKMRFYNKQYDAWYEEALSLPDKKARFRLYRQMDSLLMAEAPVVPLFYDEVVRMIRKEVQGLEPNPMNTLQLEQVRKVD